METEKQIIEDFKNAVSETWARDGKNTWPVDINSITHLFMDIFFEELLNDIDKLEEKGFDEMDISTMLKTPARIIRLIMPSVQGMKKLRMSREKQRKYVILLLSMVENLKYGNLCNRDGKNIILSPIKFRDAIDVSKMISTTKDNSMIVHKLCGILWAYSEVVCFRAHGLSKEFHGPYRHPDYKEDFLIREFFCLNAVELWDECKSLKYGSIKIVTAYKDLGLTIDIFNHLSIKQGRNYIDSLRYFYIDGDGNPLSLDEVNSLCMALSEVITSITTKIEKLDWRKLAEKYAEIFWFSKKELRDELKLDWHFPQIVKERIESGELNTRLQNLSQKDLQRLLKIAF
ncbi:hypothetical protein THIOM_000007 [Candidatus Thiomargarita nelsonii]|uniref:Uncharacterized protein n=1 Tax=Candidatus Thiomargarita nelsonii TaxID=1003181 RepID=A0A0A6P1M9_9GAMM|nr:hypothetical protein THIOM_000007 [Candidatus Thiomargarita nelsonii]